MGDFDRKQDKTASKDQSKQIIIMAALGVLLIGVMGYHYVGKGPAAAVASAGIPMPVVDETAEQASKALQEDPTAALLRQQKVDDKSLSVVPRNPFLMSEGWRSTLIAEVAAPATPVATPSVATPTVTPRQRVIPTLKAESFKLGSTMRQGGGYLAILNGRIVSAGAIVGDARVVDIQEGRVVLQPKGFADAPTIELRLEPKLND